MEMPTTFLAQAIARWGKDRPEFFKKVQNICYYIMIISSVVALIIWYVTDKVYPGLLHKEAPYWLGFIREQLLYAISLLFGFATGGLTVASTTLPGVSPPLETEKDDSKPTMDELLAIVANQQNQINELKASQPKP